MLLMDCNKMHHMVQRVAAVVVGGLQVKWKVKELTETRTYPVEH